MNCIDFIRHHIWIVKFSTQSHNSVVKLVRYALSSDSDLEPTKTIIPLQIFRKNIYSDEFSNTEYPDSTIENCKTTE